MAILLGMCGTLMTDASALAGGLGLRVVRQRRGLRANVLGRSPCQAAWSGESGPRRRDRRAARVGHSRVRTGLILPEGTYMSSYGSLPTIIKSDQEPA